MMNDEFRMMNQDYAGPDGIFVFIIHHFSSNLKLQLPYLFCQMITYAYNPNFHQSQRLVKCSDLCFILNIRISTAKNNKYITEERRYFTIAPVSF